MKNCSYILMSLFLLLISCKEDSQFTEKDLYQTQWSGNLTYHEKGSQKECSINITFETLSTGRYIIENPFPESEYSSKTTIQYNITDKIITIYDGVNNIILGDWWIEEYSNKNLLLKREPNTKYESILTLTKL